MNTEPLTGVSTGGPRPSLRRRPVLRQVTSFHTAQFSPLTSRGNSVTYFVGLLARLVS